MLNNKDLDVKIMTELNEKDFKSLCIVNKYTQQLCQSDIIYINRLRKNYPHVIQFKPQIMSWKKFYLKALYYILKLKDEYKFDYVTGNPLIYYNILENAPEGKAIIWRAGEMGYIDLIQIAYDNEGIYKFDSLKNEIVHHFSGSMSLEFIKETIERDAEELGMDELCCGLSQAAKKNNFHVFEYLFGISINKNINRLTSLCIHAGRSGNMEIIDLMMKNGYTSSSELLDFLIGAIQKKHKNLINYFIDKVNLEDQGYREEVFLSACRKNNLFIVKKICEKYPQDRSFSYLGEGLKLSFVYESFDISKYLIGLGVHLSKTEINEAIGSCMGRKERKERKINQLISETF
jgi:hypothetical protein